MSATSNKEVDELIKRALALPVEERKWLLQQLRTKKLLIGKAFSDEQKVLKAIEAKPQSPRDIEENPPEGMEGRNARVAVQTLLDEGRVELDDHLKLVIS